MLVTRREPTMADVRTAVKNARRDAGLGTADLAGNWAEDDPLVEISADVSSGELLLQLFRPALSRTTAAEPYTIRLGLAPPADADGLCWLTAAAMSASATDDEVVAALAVVRHLLVAADGYLVVNGEYAALDGVPEPERVVTFPAPPRKTPPARAFWAAYTPTPAIGEPGWRWAVDLLRDVLADHPALRPMWIEEDGEWRPFRPTRPAPAWWPTTQRLLTPEPYLRWRLDGAFGPGDRYSQLSVDGDLDPDAAQALLPQLVELARTPAYGLDYGLLHAWHPDEPAGPSGVRVGRDGPWLFLTPIDLATEWLPNLFWAQIFGPPWVELFGADRLASVPAYRVEEVAPDRWLVQLTERLGDVVDDHDRFDRIRAAAKAHLGADAFYSAERGLTGPYRVATIPTLVDRGLVDEPPGF